jgi:DNA-binding winged helix-turn-helix (wHTH) protein
VDATKFRRLDFDGYTLEPLNVRLTLAGQEIALPPRAFEVLRLLVERAPNLVRKEELMEAVCPTSSSATTRWCSAFGKSGWPCTTSSS